MTAPELVLPSVELVRHELRDMVKRGVLPQEVQHRIDLYLRLPANAPELDRQTYRTMAAANVLLYSSVLIIATTEGVFSALLAEILPALKRTP